MLDILLTLLLLILGTAFLFFGADRFVSGSAASAKYLGMTPAMIGLTIVAIGTSAPEIVVSASAAFNDEGALGIGNAIGSNIANIGLVLGATALFSVSPLICRAMKLELILLLLVTVTAAAFLSDQQLTRTEGLLLLLCSALLLLLLIYRARTQKTDNTSVIAKLPPYKATQHLLGGLLILLLGAKMLVFSATVLATKLGVSPMIIGLTIVALGTSLPELATSIASTIKGHYDIAIGNIIGSNILNLLAVMSLPGIIAPHSALDEQLFTRDVVVMGALTVLLVSLAWRCAPIGRCTGLLLISCYIGYYFLIFLGQSVTL